MTMIRIGMACLAGSVIATVWGGFAGGVHPFGDSLSLLRLLAGGFCAMLMLVMRGMVWRLALGGTCVVAMWTTMPLFLNGSPGEGLTLYSKNIWFGNQELPALAADITQSGADVVTLQEVSRRNDRLLGMLAPTYPHQHLCRFSGWGGVAVVSKYPISAETCTQRRGLAAAQINKDGQDIWIGSIHLPWPFPYANDTAAKAVEDVVLSLEGPVVLAGDFNIFPWANSVGQLQRAARVQPLRPLRPTFSLQGVPLFLDHVHAPGGGQVTYRPGLGSDHLGVLAEVDLIR